MTIWNKEKYYKYAKEIFTCDSPTGYTIEVFDGTEVKTYTVVIKGDVNGDGKIDVSDLAAVKLALTGEAPLEGAYKQAALSGYEKEISVMSYVRIKRHILGIKEISQQEQ